MRKLSKKGTIFSDFMANFQCFMHSLKDKFHFIDIVRKCPYVEHIRKPLIFRPLPHNNNWEILTQNAFMDTCSGERGKVKNLCKFENVTNSKFPLYKVLFFATFSILTSVTSVLQLQVDFGLEATHCFTMPLFFPQWGKSAKTNAFAKLTPATTKYPACQAEGRSINSHSLLKILKSIF